MSTNISFNHFHLAIAFFWARESVSAATLSCWLACLPSSGALTTLEAIAVSFTSLSLKVLRIVARATTRLNFPRRLFGTIAKPGLIGDNPILNPPVGTFSALDPDSEGWSSEIRVRRRLGGWPEAAVPE